jgi:hypothetical protein
MTRAQAPRYDPSYDMWHMLGFQEEKDGVDLVLQLSAIPCSYGSPIFVSTEVGRLGVFCATPGLRDEWFLRSSTLVSILSTIDISKNHSRVDFDSVWAICAAVSTVSSKHILLVNNFRKSSLSRLSWHLA